MRQSSQRIHGRLRDVAWRIAYVVFVAVAIAAGWANGEGEKIGLWLFIAALLAGSIAETLRRRSRH